MEFLPLQEIILRILFSVFAGALIGIERGRHREMVSLRPHILISLGSTLLMLLSMYVPYIWGFEKGYDPSRIAAQVVSGIGFLGAGAIIKLGVNVKGLTTASTIWIASAIGLTIGAGYYVAAFVGLLLVILVLLLADSLEKILFREKIFKEITITCEGNLPFKNDILNLFKENKIQLFTMNFKRNISENKSKLVFHVIMSSLLDAEELTKELEKFLIQKDVKVHEISIQNLD